MLKFNVIYADPPWAYNNNASRGAASKKYRTTAESELARMHIAPHIADDCACFMWATFPMLQEALDLMKAWGFEYKTVAFVWVKTNPKAGTPFWGMGNYTRTNAELVLLGVKGKPERLGKGVHQVVEECPGDVLYAPRGEHSVKPLAIRDRIVELFGDVPRLEMFARDAAEGWAVFGDQAPDSIRIRTIKHG